MSKKVRISIVIDDDIHEKIKEYLEIAKINNPNESLSKFN